MKNVHLILPDLFLPSSYAAEVSADLALPGLRKLLARGTAMPVSARSVEAALSVRFAGGAEVAIAALSARYDGLADGHYLRVDPVHLQLQRDQMLLSQVAVSADEAAQFCASLNEHFAESNLQFFAPHPQRWYVRVERVQDMHTTPLSEVIGSNVRGALPHGADAARWLQIGNEIQMLLYAHPLNAAREARGEVAVNSLWVWGGGEQVTHWQRPCDVLYSDEVLAQMFAVAAGVNCHSEMSAWQTQNGEIQLVYCALTRALQAGDLHAWREAVMQFENVCAWPLYQALRRGEIQSVEMLMPNGTQSRGWKLTRRDTWKIWRRERALADYSLSDATSPTA